MFGKKKNSRVYLDWAAATPLLPEAKAAMEAVESGNFANPSAIHAEGQVARDAVEAARAQVAAAVQVRPEYVTFTSGGTEGNNIVISGVVEALHAAGRAYEDMNIVTTKIEHPSVLKAMDKLAEKGVEIRYTSLRGARGHSTGGHISVADFTDGASIAADIDEKTVLVSTAYVNSEIGTVQSVRGIRNIIEEAQQKHGTQIYFHLDAAQAPLWLSCQFEKLRADAVVLDAAKFCGPKGVGILIQSPRLQLQPLTHGGGQERGLRPGTENVAGVVGAAVALQWAQAGWKARAAQVDEVKRAGLNELLAEIPGAVQNTPTNAQGERVANNINISIPGLDTEYAAVVLDKHGFAVSTKSACSGAGGGASAVVLATTADPARAASTLRITLGPDTTLDQLKLLTQVLKKHVEKMEKY